MSGYRNERRMLLRMRECVGDWAGRGAAENWSGWAAQWVEQAGKGAAKIWARRRCDPERAPAVSPYENLSWCKWISAGARLGLKLKDAQFSAAPFPACSTH